MRGRRGICFCPGLLKQRFNGPCVQIPGLETEHVAVALGGQQRFGPATPEVIAQSSDVAQTSPKDGIQAAPAVPLTSTGNPASRAALPVGAAQLSTNHAMFVAAETVPLR